MISGWAARNGEIGICYGELQTAIAEAHGKVRLIQLPLSQSSQSNKEQDKKFQEFASTLALFRGAKANTGRRLVHIRVFLAFRTLAVNARARLRTYTE
jgi:hypothetical protein